MFPPKAIKGRLGEEAGCSHRHTGPVFVGCANFQRASDEGILVEKSLDEQRDGCRDGDQRGHERRGRERSPRTPVVLGATREHGLVVVAARDRANVNLGRAPARGSLRRVQRRIAARCVEWSITLRCVEVVCEQPRRASTCGKLRRASTCERRACVQLRGARTCAAEASSEQHAISGCRHLLAVDSLDSFLLGHDEPMCTRRAATSCSHFCGVTDRAPQSCDPRG